MDSFLKLHQVSKKFGPIEALQKVDLQVGADELLVVLGPTGAGKTTLLRTIAGLEEVDSGTLEMDGEDISQSPPAERDVAFVLQNFSLYPDWTVRHNMAFPLQAPGRNLSAGEIAEQVAWAADLLHLTHLLDRNSNQLSGGEMQRVAIGRAIVRRPRLFLFDEPLTNLDAKLREALRVELVVLRRQLGIPMIYVTHDQAEALSMGDRIAVLARGQIRQLGTPKAIYQRPVSPLVARQLGQPAINLIEVKAVEGHWLTAAGVPVGPAGGQGQGLLGVRPEDISPEGGPLAARIRLVEDTGPQWILLVDWGGIALHLLVGKGRPFAPGDEIWPCIDQVKAVVWQD